MNIEIANPLRNYEGQPQTLPVSGDLMAEIFEDYPSLTSFPMDFYAYEKSIVYDLALAGF